MRSDGNGGWIMDCSGGNDLNSNISPAEAEAQMQGLADKLNALGYSTVGVQFYFERSRG